MAREWLPEEAAAVVASFHAGDGVRVIARRYDVIPNAIEKVLGFQGVNFLKCAPLIPFETLRRMHWDEGMTILAIADHFKITRRAVERIMIAHGMRCRSISEDNVRRYAGMSTEQIKAQTQSANKSCRGRPKSDDFKSRRAIGVQNARKLSDAEERVIADLDAAGYTDHQALLAFDIYNLDLAFPGLLVAIEVDGGNWHATQKKIIADEKKAALMLAHGWCLLRLQVHAGCRPKVSRVLLPSLVGSETGAQRLLSALCRLWS